MGARGSSRAKTSSVASAALTSVLGLFAFAATARAEIALVQHLGTASSKTAGSSLAVTLANPVMAGHSIIVTFAMDDAAGAVTCADDSGGGHTYGVDVDVSNAGNVRTVICSAHDVQSVTAGTVITVTHPSVTARALSAVDFRGLAQASTLDQTQSGTGSSANPASGSTAATTVANELLIGAIGVEGPIEEAFAPGASWTALRRDGTTGQGAASNITIDPEYRIVTMTGTYQADGTITSRDWAAAIATYKEDPFVLSVGATGTQTALLTIAGTDQYVGGAFTLVRDSTTTDVTEIVLSETNSVDATPDLSNVKIYYETAATCTFDGTESVFATAASFDVSEKATLTSFVTDTVTYNSGGSLVDFAAGIAVDSADNVYVAGSVGPNGTDWAVRRYDSAGNLDLSWGNDGMVTYNSGGTQYDAVTAIAVDAADSIYVVGYQATNGYDWAVRKYDPTGSLDTAWGSGGMVTWTSAGTLSDFARAIAIDTSNNIYVAGMQDNAADWVINKYDSSGTLDGTWGSGGTIIYDSGGSDDAYAIAVDAAGRIYVAGWTGTFNRDWAVRKYDATGTLDATWGSGGMVTYDSGGSDQPRAVTLDALNNLYVAGSIDPATVDWAVRKYDASGSLDGAWGTAGMVTYNSGGAQSDIPFAVLLDSADNLYVAGQQGTNTTDWAVRKYDAGGSLDVTWGTGGMVNYSTAGGEAATGIALDSAGSLYVAGRHAFNGTDWALKKYDLTGDLCEPLTVGTSQVCLYAVLDVGSGASAGELLDLEIGDACTDITTSRGSVSCGTTPLPGTTELATAEVRVFYSIGTDAGDLKTGTPDITIAGGLATLDVAQTNDIGVGDVIDFDSPSTLVYIWDVVSPTQFRVQNADGSAAADVPGPGVSVNSIERAFNSVSQAVTESSDVNHLNNTDLVAANRRLTWVCYDDAAFNLSAPTTISGYTTDSTHFITLTVAGADQVATGNSQRHRGFAGAGVVFEASPGTITFLSVTEPYTRVEWVEFDGNDVGTTEGIVLEGTADSSLVSGVMLHNLTGTPGNETSTASGVFIDPGNDGSEVRNSIVYAYDGDGVHVSGSNAVVANSTFYLGRTTPSSQSVQTDTGAGVTASVFNVLAVGPETDFWENTAGGLSLYNSITTDSSACDYDVSGTCLTGVQPETEFISLAGTINLHLRGGARAIDFGQTLGTFSNDVDEDARPQGAAYDAGADETFFSSAITYYRSIGTAPDLVNEGTITVTAGSSTVTKVGGLGWLAQNRGRGDVIVVNGSDQYVILNVVSDDVLTLASLPTTSYTGGTYTIARQFRGAGVAEQALRDWEDCIDGPPGTACTYFPVTSSSLVADARAEFGIAYADSDFVLSSSFEIDDSTTDAVHSIRLTADGTNRHNGTPGAGVIVDANRAPNEIHVRDSNVTLEWLELIRIGGASSRGAVRVIANAPDVPQNVLLQNLLIHDFLDLGVGFELSGIRLSGDGGKSVTIRNSMIWNGDRHGIEADEVTDTVTIENCSIDNISDNTDGSASGIFAALTTDVLVKNTIVTRSGTNDYQAGAGGFSASSTNNVSEDLPGSGGAPGGSAMTGVVPSDIFVAPGSDLHLKAGAAAIDSGVTLAGFSDDIDGGVRPAGLAWDRGADEFGATTEVELLSFEAVPLDSAAELSWRTGSELDNLGFYLHRSLSKSGPWTRITPSMIPGLGSSPEGASYSYRDTGLTNGVRYFYRLEDIDAASKSTFHGPVSAVPGTSAEGEPEQPGEGEPSDDSISAPGDPEPYGDPEGASWRVVSRTARSLILEAWTPGFYATETEAGYQFSIPGFDEPASPTAPAIPFLRAVVDARVGQAARVAWVRHSQTRTHAGLYPAAVGEGEMIVAWDGTVRPGRRPQRLMTSDEGMLPELAVKIAGDGFIGDEKRLALELSPLRFDTLNAEMHLSRRMRVKVVFDRASAQAEVGSGSRGRRQPRSVSREAPRALAYLHTGEKGLYGVSFETLFPEGQRPLPVDSLKLTLQGEPVPFNVQPRRKRHFRPGSMLFFYAAQEAASVDYSSEVSYALELGSGGVRMKVRTAAPNGKLPRVTAAPVAQADFETNRFYQAGLLHAPDIWLWDYVTGGTSKSHPLEISGLDAAGGVAQLHVVLQGASDAAEVAEDHHLSVSVNGTAVGETWFGGKVAQVLSVSLPASLLREGENELTLTNVGDTGASSFVFLDRVHLVYPETAAMRGGRFEGVFPEGGVATVQGSARYALDVTSPQDPRWLVRLKHRRGSVSLSVGAHRSYELTTREALRVPRVSKPLSSTLRDTAHQADYVLIAPEAYLEAAEPLLERRRDQGLVALGVSFEEVVSEFGYGRPSPEAIRDFLAYAYHSWRKPSLRYVLLLGDSSYDPRNMTGLDQGSPLPAQWVKTSYLWTSSDPTLGAINGEDLIPDVALGRLPAKTLEEADALVGKVLAWEGHDLEGTAVLVADNRDLGGDFEADVLDIKSSFLGDRETKTLFLRELGAGTRREILSSFDAGASFMGYVGHGGTAVWASENVLNSWDPPKLLAQSRQPLMMTFNCLNGYFVAPNYDSLSEAFLKVEGRGTIGAFTPSGLSLNAPAHRFHRAVMAELTSGNRERLGDAVLAAQAAYAAEGVMLELLAIYHLLGDPGMRIR